MIPLRGIKARKLIGIERDMSFGPGTIDKSQSEIFAPLADSFYHREERCDSAASRYCEDMAPVADAVVVKIAGWLAHPQLSTYRGFIDKECREYALSLHHYLQLAFQRLFW